LALLRAEGLLLVPFSPTTMRAMTHLDVSREQIEQAYAILKKVFAAS
jgi:threonine aldolase